MKKTIEGYTYKINEHIGKGYSSTVHQGRNDKTGEQVSIKVIEMGKLEDPINQMLLQHEILALKKLAFSPAVLHLYDVYATKNNTYIVTELCDGDLGNLLKKRKNIPYPEAIDIIKQIISGYLDVYNCGYLHRDIKPANIFYKGNQYKIGDFGFAIPRVELEQHKNYNVGSPVYMPPEALKDNVYSVSCDTWAIGIILFQMIKGVVPWRAISEEKLHQKILTEPLDQLTLGLPEIARNFLSRVLHLDPKMRMSVDEMINWPNRLASVEIINMMPSCSPLREIKNQIHQPDMKLILTPKEHPTNPFKFHHIPQPPPTQKNINTANHEFFPRMPSVPSTNTNNYGSTPLNPENVMKPQNYPLPLSDEFVSKETVGFATNIINYMKFVHRILNILGLPSGLDLSGIINGIANHLHNEIETYDEFIKNYDGCPFEKWEGFLSSQKGSIWKTKLAKCKAKYKIFHPVSQSHSTLLNEDLIKDTIVQIVEKLEVRESGDEGTVIALDYLTTFYQLWYLKIKHSCKDFLKMSKIDLIVEGNPYSVNKDHLIQIKRKLVLFDVLN